MISNNSLTILYTACASSPRCCQAHFRNSFRIDASNNALRAAVREVQEQHRREDPQGSSRMNFHFLDTFHLSLALHWSGHATGPNENRLDPVHYKEDHVNEEFAELLFDGAAALCSGAAEKTLNFGAA